MKFRLDIRTMQKVLVRYFWHELYRIFIGVKVYEQRI
jgi:hypothetical protein